MDRRRRHIVWFLLYVLCLGGVFLPALHPLAHSTLVGRTWSGHAGEVKVGTLPAGQLLVSTENGDHTARPSCELCASIATISGTLDAQTIVLEPISHRRGTFYTELSRPYSGQFDLFLRRGPPGAFASI